MVLGFKDRFVPFVLDGSKRHSIRAGERWRVGMWADCYSKVRQKGMTLLLSAIVVKVEKIEIFVRPAPLVALISIEGIPILNQEADVLAWADGFRRYQPHALRLLCLDEMSAFWRKEHKPGPFTGQLIHWDYERRIPVRTAPLRLDAEPVARGGVSK